VSAIAWFHVLKQTDLAGLVEIAEKEAADEDGPSTLDYLQDHEHHEDATDDCFAWSGYVMAHLLEALDESGIELGRNAHPDELRTLNQTGPETHLLTSADRIHLPALRAARTDSDEIVRHIENAGYGFEELGQAIDDGLEVLEQLISVLTDDDVLIIRIG